jgi:hypothetical protein
VSYLLKLAGIADPGFATVFAGWNVWAVWQVKDLPLSVWMAGVSRDRQLQIWVEDAVRLGAPGTIVADSIDLKGGQVQILAGPPAGLSVVERKDIVPNLKMLDSEGELRYVRFYNRGAPSKLIWPSDGSYMLESVFQPSASAPATSGPAPMTIPGTLNNGVSESLSQSGLTSLLFTGGLIALGVYALPLILTTRKVSSRAKG